jgi:peptide/nickel transport system permease protein
MVAGRLIALRCGTAVLTLLAVSVVIFIGINLLPGNAATEALGINVANKHALASEEAAFGLNKPLLTRYFTWLGDFVQGNLGKTLPSGGPVSSLLSDRLRNTAVLALGTLIFLLPLATFLGVVSALRREGFFDHSVAVSTLALISTPEFVIGTLVAAIFATWLGWFPPVSLIQANVSIFSQLQYVALPLITLVLAVVAQATRLIRATTSEVLRSEYVQSAVLRGTPRGVLLRRHVLPNAFGPVLQVIALTLGYFFGGVVVTEYVFSYPGIGTALTTAVAARDLATVEAIGMIVAGVYILGNLFADVTVILMNPRLRRARG